MKGLGCSREEAEDVYNYDYEVDHSKQSEHDLPPEKAKVAQEMARTGTRKSPMIPNLKKRERKPNATKGEIIAVLAKFLEENEDFIAENVQIMNKERQISFESAGNQYELTLIQKRKPKK